MALHDNKMVNLQLCLSHPGNINYYIVSLSINYDFTLKKRLKSTLSRIEQSASPAFDEPKKKYPFNEPQDNC